MAEEIDVVVSLRDELSRPAGKAAEAIESFGRRTRRTRRPVEDLEKSSIRLGHQLVRASAASGRTARDMHKVGKAADKASVELTKLEKVLKRIDFISGGGGGRGGFGGGGGRPNAFARLTRAMRPGVLMIPLFTALLVAASTALVGLGAAAVAAVNGLAPLSGLLAGIPILWAAAAQGIGLAVVAFKGIEYAEKQLAPFRRALKTTGNDIQRTFWRELTPALSHLVPLLKSIRPQIDMATRSLARLGTEALETANTPWFRTRIQRVMGTNVVIFENLARATWMWARAFLAIADAGGAVFTSLTLSIANTATRFAEWTETLGGRQSIMAFFQDMEKTLRTTIRVLTNFGIGLFNIFRAAAPLTDHLSRGIRSVAASFRKWTEDANNVTKVQDFFRSMIPVVDSVGRFLWSIVTAMVSMAADPDVQKATIEFFDELSRFMPILAKFMTENGPVFLAFLTSVVALFGAILDSIPAEGVEWWYGGVIELIDAVTRFIELTKPFIGWLFLAGVIFIGFIRPALRLLTRLTRRIMSLTKAVRESPKAAKAWKWLVNLFSKLWPAVRVVSKWLWRFAVKYVWPLAVRFLPRLGLALVAAIVAATGPIGLAVAAIIAVVAALVAALIWAYYKFDWFQKAVDDSIANIGQSLKWLGALIKDVFTFDLGAVADKLTDAASVMRDMWNSAGEWYSDKLGLIGRWAGGPVTPGQPYMVGELGPELYVPAIGPMKLIGMQGPEIQRFAASGEIIPSHLVMPTLAAHAAPSLAPTATNNSQVVYQDNIRVEVPITVANSEIDIERAVYTALRKYERDRRERR